LKPENTKQSSNPSDLSQFLGRACSSTLKFSSKSIKLPKSVILTKIAPQFRKVLFKWTPQEAKLLHGLKNLFQALQHHIVCFLSLSETGGVFTFGKSKFAENVPSKFWIRNDHFLQVACGDEHTVLIAGKIFLNLFIYLL
jgi:hypothetical protein